MRKRTAYNEIWCADFETTVYEGQTRTDVWASACVQLYGNEVSVFNDIRKQLAFFMSRDCNLIAYFHNLRFDGSFWLSFLLTEMNYTQAFILDTETNLPVGFLDNDEMPENSFKYLISDKNLWYTFTLKTATGKLIEIRDSLKLMPFSLKELGKAFKTEHQKTDMEYTGKRVRGGVITDEEREYICNDVLVLKEALEYMYNSGHDRLTIGSCCMAEFRKLSVIGSETIEAYKETILNNPDNFIGFNDLAEYKRFYPDIYEFTINPQYGVDNAGEYILKSYAGGWCYLVPEKANQIFEKGVTADVNSLYPSMMHSMSGNKYPIGLPVFWKGDIPKEAKDKNKFYFVRLKTRFYLRKGKLPFIRVRGNSLYNSKESLESSDVVIKKDIKDKYGNIKFRKGQHLSEWYDDNGEIHDTKITMTLTWNEYELFKEHYILVDCEILDGCWFYAKIGLFDAYINKYAEIKQHSTGAMRTLAKLFLNNLYGRLAATTNSSFNVAELSPDGIIDFNTVEEHEKTPGYIPCGSAITSYARCFTIRAAQKNFYGADKPGFIYADTDSIHCNLKPEDIKGVPVHDTKFCHWKLESYWDKAIFVRQKTYIEHVTHEDGEAIDKPYYNIKCAGMGKIPKILVNFALEHTLPKKEDRGLNWKDSYTEFVEKGMKLTDFKLGLKVPGNLKQRRIPGGVLLIEQTYEMR